MSKETHTWLSGDVVDVEWIVKTSEGLKPMSTDAKLAALSSDLDVSIDLRQVALEIIRQVLTEENTDVLVAWVKDRVKLPIWLAWFPIGLVLDQILPDTILQLLERVLGGESV
jgi:hypothetical protein